MSVFRTLFGPSKDEVWQQLSAEIQADFMEGGFWRGSKVQATVRAWTITLDTYAASNVIYTRMRAPYVNRDGLRFTIYRKGMFSALGKLLGVQDIEVGDPAFDEDFIIQGNQEQQVRALLANPQIRRLMAAQPTFRLEVKDDEGWFGAHFPAGVDELHFQVTGAIKEVERLKLLYELFAAVLDQLCQIGSATDADPQVKLSNVG